MSITLSSTNINFPIIKTPLKRELSDVPKFENNGKDVDPENQTNGHQNNDSSRSSCEENSTGGSDLENNGPISGEPNVIDYSEHAYPAITLHPVADFIKKEFPVEFDFSNNFFRNQDVAFKAENFGARSPFLLPAQLYKNFLTNLGKRKSESVADCYKFYSRNILFPPNGFALDVSDDENNADSADEKTGGSSAFVWSGGGGVAGGGQEQPQQTAAGVGAGGGGGGAQGLVHWMSVMAEHMGAGGAGGAPHSHHDPSHYALPPWNNGAIDHCGQQKDGLEYTAWPRPRNTMAIKQGYEAKMSMDGGAHGAAVPHHQHQNQMLYGAGLAGARSGSSSSSPVGGGGGGGGGGLLVVPQPLGKPAGKLQQLHAHARKYHCKMCPQVGGLAIGAGAGDRRGRKKHISTSPSEFRAPRGAADPLEWGMLESSDHQVFGSKADLQLHTQIHLREAKPYRCTQCPKAFANSSYLAQHSRIHLGIKPYRCEICQRKFTQLSHLQQHIRTHTGDKPYRCTQVGCTKAFSQLSNLQSHSRCHQTDKPFKCNSCYKCFTHEKDLLEHIPKHKESKHLKTHICQYCGKSYTQETYLSKHMNKHAERADKRPPIAALGLAGLNRSLGAAAPAAAPFGDHPYWPKVSPDSAAHMSDESYPQQREDEHEMQQRALFAQHESQDERSAQPPVSASSAFTPINSMAPHLNGLSHHGSLPSRPYLYDPLHFQQAKQQPNTFPNQLISLHQIRNYAHQPSGTLLPSEHLLQHSLAHKDKQ